MPLNQIPPENHRLFREEITDRFYPGFPSFIRLQSPTVIESMLFDLIAEYNNQLIHYELSVKGMFIQLCIHLLWEVYWYNTSIFSAQKQMLQIKRYLDANINRDVELDKLAGYIHLSKYYLSQFKTYFGASPIEYHRVSRINKCKELIQFSNLTISEVAEQMGFGSIYTFSRTFKRLEGVAPTFYRRKR